MHYQSDDFLSLLSACIYFLKQFQRVKVEIYHIYKHLNIFIDRRYIAWDSKDDRTKKNLKTANFLVKRLKFFTDKIIVLKKIFKNLSF